MRLLVVQQHSERAVPDLSAGRLTFVGTPTVIQCAIYCNNRPSSFSRHHIIIFHHTPPQPTKIENIPKSPCKQDIETDPRKFALISPTDKSRSIIPLIFLHEFESPTFNEEESCFFVCDDVVRQVPPDGGSLHATDISATRYKTHF